MALMFTSYGWAEVQLPPFLDLDEICRLQDEEEERRWQEEKERKAEGNNEENRSLV